MATLSPYVDHKAAQVTFTQHFLLVRPQWTCLERREDDGIGLAWIERHPGDLNRQ